MKTRLTVISVILLITIVALYVINHFLIANKPVMATDSMTNEALIVMDIQKDFFEEDGRLPIHSSFVSPVLSTANTLIKQYEYSEAATILYVTNEYEQLQFLANRGRNFAAIKGTEGAELDERLLVFGDNFISKNKPNAFSSPKFTDTLTEYEVGHLVIIGVYAEACVMETAKEALKQGYSVTLVEDAIGSESQKAKEEALKVLKSKGAKIMTAEEYLKNNDND
ncbi:cysteine hydrolase family protein [Bacillus coahuilensis]|uniref:cysteine hydrolase family protein n=1 Tax=Bacillus coahuilensis TaxID=408580 RepID=UPI00018507A7|nr:isochorismatase family cysteine hydrolase [Bacillus coahuilensis]